MSARQRFDGFLPNERRNFVHKRLIGAVGGFLSGGPLGAATGFVKGGGGGAPQLQTQSFARPSARNARHCDAVGRLTAAGIAAGATCGGALTLPGHCEPGFVMGPDGFCVFGSSPVGVSLGFQSEAVMGQYGAGMNPVRRDIMTLDCLPGMVLGKDEICYNRRDISNKERKWPRGTRPLGTPGEMAALRKAASFGRRMETTVKRMQKIGVLKKAAPRRAKGAPKQITAGRTGITVIDTE